MSKNRLRSGYHRNRGCFAETLEIRLNLTPLLSNGFDNGEHQVDDHEDDHEDEYAADDHDSDAVTIMPETTIGFSSPSPGVGVTSLENDDENDHSGGNAVDDSHGDDDETLEFEALESLIKDAHQNGTDVALEDHHLELVDDVIAHLADELLVPADDINAFVVAPVSTKVSDQSSDVPVIESAEETVAGSNVRTVDELEAKEQAIAVESTPESMSDIKHKEDEQQKQQGGQPDQLDAADQSDVTPSPVIAPVVNDAGLAAFDDVDSQAAIDESRPVQDAAANRSAVAETANAEMQAAGFQSLVVPGLGIRFGSALALVNGGFKLHANPGSDAPLNRDEVMSASVIQSRSSTSLLVSAAIAGGALAAANADQCPAVQKVIRRIRRSIRPIA